MTSITGGFFDEADHVVCLDEMGPVAVKAYPAPKWTADAHRPNFEPDYSRREKQWVYGAFEPHTGLAFTRCYDRRNSENVVDFLDCLVEVWPTGKVHIIIDNLPSHKTIDVLLWVWSHERFVLHFQPTGAAWLNLIEPWWKTLRNEALVGSNYADVKELKEGIQKGTERWNARRHPYAWKKAA